MGKIDRTGEERLNNDGLLMKIINYNKYNDIDILFLESGYIAKHKSYGKFKIGSIKDKTEYNKRLGEVNKNNQGYNMKIIEYNSSINITVQFEDGTIVENKTYRNFLNGEIDKNKASRLKEINKNTRGEVIEIIEYIDSLNVKVYFPEYDYIVNTRYASFKKGEVNCPYERTVYNIGYLGEGKYSPKTHKKHYNAWYNMIKRCVKSIEYPSYENCKVCEEWLCFQNFAEWYDEHYYSVSTLDLELDKDIFQYNFDNKIYSPQTCCLVPHKINSMFRRHVCRKDFDNINWNELPSYIVNKLNEIREGLNE